MSTQTVVTRESKETYTLPINLAIQYKKDTNKNNMALVETLIRAAPELLTSKDGADGLSPIHVLLKHHADDYERALDFMLLQNPSVASLVDCRENTPLHYACMYGASMNVVRRLCMLDPQAITQCNRNGQTPFQLSQRSSRMCSDEMAWYLWEKHDEQF